MVDAESDKRMRLMIQNAITRYMEIMGPKLHNLVVQIVTRQTVDKSADQVSVCCTAAPTPFPCGVEEE